MVLHLFTDGLETPEVLMLFCVSLAAPALRHAVAKSCLAGCLLHGPCARAISLRCTPRACVKERSSPRGRKIWGVVTIIGIIYSLTVSQVRCSYLCTVANLQCSSCTTFHLHECENTDSLKDLTGSHAQHSCLCAAACAILFTGHGHHRRRRRPHGGTPPAVPVQHG